MRYTKLAPKFIPDPDNVNDIKDLHKLFGNFIRQLKQKSIIFFSININLYRVGFDNTKYHTLNIESEEYIIKSFQALLDSFSDLEFIEFGLFVTELNKSNDPHLHGILGFRTLFNCQENILYQIEDLLARLDLFDTRVNFLPKFMDVVRYFNYMSKDLTKKRKFNYIFDVAYSSHYSYIYQSFGMSIESLNVITEFNNLIPMGPTYDGRQYVRYGKHYNLKGMKIISKDLNIIKMVYFLSLYFQLHDMFIHKGNVYKKILNTYISYEYLGNLNYLKENYLLLMKELSNHIKLVDYKELCFHFVLHSDWVIKSFLKFNYLNKKELHFDILEFKDGIYFARYDKFICKYGQKNYDLSQLSGKIFTIRYYDSYYANLLRYGGKPRIWYDKLLKNFNEKLLEEFCLLFRDVLFDVDKGFSKKSNILFLLGISNSGKSRLILDVARHSYGTQNVGTLHPNVEFLFENIIGKNLAILDEIDLPPQIINLLKKLGSHEMLPIYSKFKELRYEQVTSNILVALNYKKQINSLFLDDCILNRINKFILKNECKVSNEEYDKIIKEIPKILVYCNKLYYKYYYINKKSLPKHVKQLFFILWFS